MSTKNQLSLSESSIENTEKNTKEKLEDLKNKTIESKIDELKEKTKPEKHRRTKQDAMIGGLAALGGLFAGKMLGKTASESQAMAYAVGSATGGIDELTAAKLIVKELATPENIKKLLKEKFPHMEDTSLSNVLEKFKKEDFVELHELLEETKDPTQVLKKLTSFAKKKNIKLDSSLLSELIGKTESINGTGIAAGVVGLAATETGEATGFLEKIKEMYSSLGDSVKTPDWLSTLSIEKITADLNIPTKEELDKIIKEQGYFGLLFGWADKMKIEIGMGQVVLMMHHGIKSGVLGKDKLNALVEKYFGSLIDIKKIFNEKLKAHAGFVELLPESFHGKDMLDFFFEQSDVLIEWIAKNPYASSMAVVGGTALVASPEKVLGITAFAAGLLGTILMKQAAKFLKDPKKFISNAGKTALIAGTFVVGQREYINRLLGVLYDPDLFPDIAEHKRVTEEARHFFNTILFVDENRKELLVEYQVPHYVDMLINQPLKLTAQAFEGLKELFTKGDLSLLVKTSGEALLTLPTYSAPILLPTAAWTTLQTYIKKEMRDGWSTEGVTTAGIEGFIFYRGTKALYHTYTKSLVDIAGKRMDLSYFSKVFWSIANPFSNEGKFVMTSVLKSMPPFKEIDEVVRGWQLGKLENYHKELKTGINNIENLIKKRTEIGENEFQKQIKNELLTMKKTAKDVTGRIFSSGWFKSMRTFVQGSHYEYMFNDSVNEIDKHFKKAENALYGFTKKSEIIDDSALNKVINSFKKDPNILGQLDTEFAEYNGICSSISRRVSALKRGNFADALTPDQFTQAKKYTSLLKKEGKLSSQELSTKTKMKGLEITKKTSTDMLNKLDEKITAARTSGNTLKVEQLLEEKMLYETTAMSADDFARNGPELFRKLSEDLELVTSQVSDEGEKARKIASIAKKMKNLEQGAEIMFKNEVDTIAKSASAKNISFSSPEIKVQLEALQNKVLDPLSASKQTLFDKLVAKYNLLTEKERTLGLAQTINTTLEGSMLTKFTQHVKGRAKLGVLMAGGIFAVKEAGKLINGKEIAFSDVLEELRSPELYQLLVDIFPVAGTISNAYSTVTGKQIIGNADLSSAWSRITSGVFTAAGALGDIAMIISLLPSGGASAGLEIGTRLAALAVGSARSGAATKLLDLWKGPITAMAEKIGWRQTLTQVLETMSKGIKAESRNATVSTLNKWATRATWAGMVVVGGGLAYDFKYKDDGEVKLAKEAT